MMTADSSLGRCPKGQTRCVIAKVNNVWLHQQLFQVIDKYRKSTIIKTTKQVCKHMALKTSGARLAM